MYELCLITITGGEKKNMLRKSKKLALILLSLLMLFATACTSEAPGSSTGSGSGSGTSSESGKTGEKTKIKFASYQTGDVAEDWEKNQFPKYLEETGVEVEHVFVNHTDTISTYMTWAAADQMPDAAMLSANYLNALIAKGMVLNLSEYTAEKSPDYDYSRYIPKLMEAYKYEDEVYALPSDLDLGLLWYNKDIFDTAGVEYPNESWTWEDLQKNAALLTSGSGPEKIYGASLADYQTYLWQNGTDIISADKKTAQFNTPDAKEAFTYMMDMVAEETAVNPNNKEPLFQSGKAAMSIGSGPWFAHYEMANVDFNWGVTAVPKGKEKATTCYGSTFAVFNNSKNTDAAVDFITWFLSDEQQLDRAEKFYWFPPTESAIENDAFMNTDAIMGMTKEQKQLVLSETEFGKAPIIVEKQNEITQVVTSELSLMWAGEKTVDETLDKINSEVDKLLN